MVPLAIVPVPSGSQWEWSLVSLAALVKLNVMPAL
jgi:hypothetical protein